MNSFNKHDIKCDKISNTSHKIENIEFHDNISICKSESQNQILPNSVRSASDDFWNDFKTYLINEKHSQSSIRDKISDARRFYHILENNDASLMTKLSLDAKSHVMKALAALSKFLGKYDEWLGIIKSYQLKWSNGNKSFNTFKSIFESQGNDINSMMKWIKDVTSVLPHDYKNILLFNTLTGLRSDEAQKSIWLIKSNGREYVDSERGMLKHYQFPSLFLRQTKNAYISLVNDQILEIARNTPKKEFYYNALRKKISIRNRLEMNMYYCRKVFATYLRNKGIEPEIIDLLQGRISSSVFVNHYYRPDINEIITKRLRPVLDELLKELID